MIEKLDDVWFFKDDLVFVNEDSDNVSFFSDDLDLNTIHFNNIDLDADILVKMLKTIIHVRLMTWCNKYEEWKGCKKYISKELMPGAWHPTRWWIDACQMTKKKKERNRSIFDWWKVV